MSNLFETLGNIFNPKKIYVGITYMDIDTILIVDEKQDDNYDLRDRLEAIVDFLEEMERNCETIDNYKL